MIPPAACDFLIVGAGAAGSVVAARLARRFPEASVVLLEAGLADPALVNRLPLAGAFAPFRKGTNWRHPARQCGREIALMQGRMPGGSSEINGMVMSLGAPADYLPWQDAAGDLWSPSACFDSFEQIRGTHDAPGPMPGTRLSHPAPLTRAFLEAAEASGQPVVPDLNSAEGARFGLVHANIREGRRHSARSAYLEPWPENLRLIAGATAHRLMSEPSGRMTVEADAAEGRFRITAEAELVLAAGAICTTALLFNSGIGPAKRLRSAGIAPHLDLPEVGQNLQNHPSFALSMATQGGSLSGLLDPRQGMPALYAALQGRPGPLGQPLFQAAGYFLPGADTPETAAHGTSHPEAQVIMAPALLPNGPRIPLRHGATFAVQQGRPLSRGRVDPNPDGGLRIDTGALSHPEDSRIMLDAIAALQDILRQPAFARHLRDAKALAPVDAAQLRARIGTAYHMCGTARMGRDEGAVCTPRLRVRGAGRLRIADASVMPRIPNAALHYPTMMIAERAAAFIIEDQTGAPPEPAASERPSP